MHDHRLVQTAVIGHKNSDHPVILPMEARELDRWRKAHPTYSYWCGLQLGGCGGELSDRRYTEKVCHFAHHPNAPNCYRTATGESSADHLFIKRGVQRLLSSRKLHGEVHTRDLGTGPGDAVDVHLPESRRRLRFQLSAVDYRAWRRADDELAADADDIDWIFASEGPVTQQVLGRHGYCLRVRCETVGGERRVHIGAEARDRTVDWAPLEDCVLTPGGIVAPHVERIRMASARPRPAAFPVQGGWLFALVPEAGVPADSPFAAEGRHLVAADVKPVDSPIIRTLLSLPGDTELPPAEHVYRVPDGGRILVRENGQGWVAEANRYVRLNAHEAQRTGLWTPPSALESRAAPEPALRTEQPTTYTPDSEASAAVKERVGTPVPASEPLTRSELVPALRDALANYAKLHSTTTWATLARTVSSELARYPEAERRRVLVEVDSPLRENVPILSALIREGAAPLPYLRDVLSRLGVPYAGTSTRINRWAAVETERAFAAYGIPSRAMPPRLPLKPEEPQVERRVRTTAPETSSARRRAVAGREGTTAVHDRHSMEQVRKLVTQLEELLPRLSSVPQRRARKAIARAHAWLALRDGTVLSAKERRRLMAQARANPTASLRNTLKAAQYDIKALQWLEKYENDSRRPKQAQADQAVAQPKEPAPDRVEQLTRKLLAVAAQGGTVPAVLLDGGRIKPDLPQRLTDVDGKATPDVPLLSALVTGEVGKPVSYFRDILKAAGLAVPQSDRALLMVWKREQERAHAAYANPPRPMPPRLVPEASA